MTWIEAIILGLLQGLAEFLPISSSGHLEIGKVLLNIEAKDNVQFTVAVHGATVLSTIVVFRKELYRLIQGIFTFKRSESSDYLFKILISMIPVFLVGIFLKDQVEGLFTGNMMLVGSMLMVTAVLLALTFYSRQGENSISWKSAFIIGIAQAIAVLPGISRSGATIATGLLLKNKKEEVARFSFLMVLIPIIGANLLDILSIKDFSETSIGVLPLVLGFVAAFISGLIACSWMINLVKRGKLIWFAVYCLIIGLIALLSGFLF
jgi:undecaprenyl-diphosphatase